VGQVEPPEGPLTEKRNEEQLELFTSQKHQKPNEFKNQSFNPPIIKNKK